MLPKLIATTAEHEHSAFELLRHRSVNRYTPCKPEPWKFIACRRTEFGADSHLTKSVFGHANVSSLSRRGVAGVVIVFHLRLGECVYDPAHFILEGNSQPDP